MAIPNAVSRVPPSHPFPRPPIPPTQMVQRGRSLQQTLQTRFPPLRIPPTQLRLRMTVATMGLCHPLFHLTPMLSSSSSQVLECSPTCFKRYLRFILVWFASSIVSPLCFHPSSDSCDGGSRSPSPHLIIPFVSFALEQCLCYLLYVSPRDFGIKVLSLSSSPFHVISQDVRFMV